MKIILIILNAASLLVALVWLYKERSWEPLVTAIGLLGGLIAIIYGIDESDKATKMKQRGGDNSNNYQSAGDINIKK